MFSSGLIRGRHECLCATSQKRYLKRIFLFTVNYCIFANGDISIRFNGKDDNVVLELHFMAITSNEIVFLCVFIQMYLPVKNILTSDLK